MEDAQNPGSAEADAREPDREPDREPAGLRAQIGAVRDAVRRLLTAHVDLARAEAGEIGGEIKRVALLAGLAFGALLALSLLLPIGLLLFLGELIFGSIGWGVLLGSFVLLDLAILAGLVALGVPGSRIGRSLLVALGLGAIILAVGIVLHIALRPWAGFSSFVFLVAWPAAAGYGVARAGIDTDALKARFYPSQTINTTKETIEWVRARTPLGPKSVAARQGLEDEIVGLEASARAAVDLPARLRRQPAKVGGAAVGAAFLLLGGPKRVFRRARRAVFGKDADLPKSMLPDEIEETLRKLGPDGDKVRGTLEREFAKFLEERAPERKNADIAGIVGGLLTNALKPASMRAGREFAERLFDPDGPSFGEGLRKARARMAADKGDQPPPA